jgi:ribose/xylose/arabinose/galactoside ABC-type transport system permease subunit
VTFKLKIRWSTPLLAAQYREPLSLAIVIQLLAVGMASLILDGGLCVSLALVSAIGYWTVVLMIILRRPQTPRPTDILIVRWLYPAVLVLILAALTFSPLIDSQRK